MSNGLNSVGSIFIMIGTGFYLAKKGLLNQETNNLFCKLLMQVALPLMIISSLPQSFTLEELVGSFRGILIAFVSLLLTYAVSYVITLVLKIDKRERGLFCALFSISNVLMIGLPINISLFGKGSTPYVALYYMVNTISFWTIGVYNIKKYSSKNEDLGILGNIKNVFSPPLIGLIIGIALIVSGLELPSFLNTSFNYIGQLCTPLSMLYMGTVIYSMNFKEIKIDITTIATLMGKFIVSPLIMIFLLSLFELPVLLGKVFIVQAAGPIMTQIAIVTEYYDVDSKYAAFMVGLSTIIYMFIIPVYVFFIL